MFAVALVAIACLSLDDQLVHDEGVRLLPYRDTRGHWTIGVGHYLTAREHRQFGLGISRPHALDLLRQDLTKARADLLRKHPWASTLDTVRHDVLVNMTFNLGIGGLSGFKATLRAAQSGDYALAAKRMRHSRWYRQTGPRARRLVKEFETGSRCAT